MTMTSDPSRMIGQRAIVTTNENCVEGTISAAGLAGVIVHSNGESRYVAAGEITGIVTSRTLSGLDSSRVWGRSPVGTPFP